jgi:hypothetical protein
MIRQAHQAEIINRDYTDFVKDQPQELQAILSDPATRAQIFAHADYMLAGQAQRGITASGTKEMFGKAMYAALGPKLHEIALGQVRGEVTNHQSRRIAKPSHGGRAPQGSNIDRAVAFAEKMDQQLFGGRGRVGISSTEEL